MNDNTSCLLAVDRFIADLDNIDWFSQVGRQYAINGTMKVTSWDEAYRWTTSPITEWCDLEAKNRIYRFMSASHYEFFTEWNTLAQTILPSVTETANNVRANIPSGAPDCVIDWLQCQIVGCTLEICYENFYRSTLYRDQIAIYMDGHFPCGWQVDREDDFPDKASLVVF